MASFTENYNLIKPSPEDVYNIGDFNGNADIIDAELKDRVPRTGDISNTQIMTFDTITGDFPVPAAGETTRTVIGKIRKFIQDFNNFKTGILTVGMLVNNAVTNNSQLPVSAAVAKVLQDQITQTNSDLTAGLSGKASVGHASSATTYGIGNASNYGHVRISDNYTSSSGAASAGMTASSAAVYNAYSSLLNSMGTWFSNSVTSARNMNVIINHSSLDLIGFQIQFYTDVYVVTAVPSLMATSSIGQVGFSYISIISSSGILQGISAINNGDGTVRIKLTLSTGVIGGNIKLFYPRQSVQSIGFSAD